MLRLTGLILIALCGVAQAQQPYAGLQTRSIKTLSDQEISDLSAGRGMGLALAAELNGYPGPSHALELKDKLHLSADQIAKLQEQFDSMKSETIPIGAALIEHERVLNDDFAKRTVTQASLEATTQKIGETQATLRAAHLKYHLSTAAVLTPDQIAQYNELRGYGHAHGAPMHHHK